MKTTILILNSLLIMLIISNTAISQTTSNIYVISPIVGDTIDTEEKIKFGLFPYYKRSEFQYGVFYQLSDTTYLLKSLVNDSMVESFFSSEEIVFNRQKIEGFPTKTEIERDSKLQNPTSSDDSLQYYKIELMDGSTFYGHIIQKSSSSIVIKTSSIPKLEIPISSIKSLEEIDQPNSKDGRYRFSNPHSTRYLYGPSAISLKKGEGYYQNTLLVLNSFNVGITDNISIGGGLEIISTFAARSPTFFITPKVGFKVSEKFHAAGGLLFARIGAFGSGTTLGTAFLSGTYGSRDNNITGSLGWGFVDGEFSERPIITLSGMKRISERAALVTENWLIPTGGYYGLFSYGVRFFGEKMAVDLAFINNRDIAQWLIIGIPYVSFTVKFGK